MRYIVAADGSEASQDAVRYAATHAEALDAMLEIVHVLTPEPELSEGEIILPATDAAVDAGKETLAAAEQLATSTVDGPVDVTTALLTGRPADAITERAAEASADAIYLGHRGLSEQREQVVGSVAKSVLDKSEVPVTVIK
jgi:nucleotide-binding universal stress UspA family protein